MSKNMEDLVDFMFTPKMYTLVMVITYIFLVSLTKVFNLHDMEPLILLFSTIWPMAWVMFGFGLFLSFILCTVYIVYYIPFEFTKYLLG